MTAKQSTKPGTALGFGLVALIALATPLIAYYEGNVPRGYADAVQIPTACMGHTGPDVHIGELYSDAQCQAWFDQDIRDAIAALDRCVKQPIPSHVAAALVSWAFNVGTGAACGSTLVKMINAGAAPAAYCAQLDRWVYAHGMKLSGLVKRRAAERALCEGRSNERVGYRTNRFPGWHRLARVQSAVRMRQADGSQPPQQQHERQWPTVSLAWRSSCSRWRQRFSTSGKSLRGLGRALRLQSSGPTSAGRSAPLWRRAG